jgi:hypothetical protein
LVVIAAGESTVLSIYSTRRDIEYFTVSIASESGPAVAIVYPGPNGSADYAVFNVPKSHIESIHVREKLAFDQHRGI